ncbi:hypothetical protein [Streptococcus hyointestinalis]|nr:hypothetical protein [Streptococcus hyointestinalis]
MENFIFWVVIFLLFGLPWLFGSSDEQVKAKRNRIIADEYKKRYKDKK